jgi:hypothetical protein
VSGDLIDSGDYGALAQRAQEYNVSVFQTTICQTENGGLCFLDNNGEPWLMPPGSLITHAWPAQDKDAPPPFSVWRDAITARNVKYKIALPPELADVAAMPLPEELDNVTVNKSDDFPIYSSQEWTAALQAVSDGKHDLHLLGNDQAGTLRHQRPGAPFFTEAKLTEEEINNGHGIELLRAAIWELDIDTCYIMLYAFQCLAPVCELPKNAAATAWLDLDDVARKTLGGYAPNPKIMEERRLKVWNAIRFGSRWFVGGQRSIQYQEKQTGRVIDTKIYASPWQIVQRQEEAQTALFPESAVPLRVELVASRPWTSLTTSPDTAQFLRFGEMLGSIPSGQAKGGWARALGMSYFIWTRTKMAEALRGDKTPTRRELLDFLPPKDAPYRELLRTTNAGRIHTYWQGAEDFLIEREIIAISGKRESKPTGAKEWDKWLDSAPPWSLGPVLQAALGDQGKKLYTSKPRQLNSAKRKRRAAKAKPAKSHS